MSLSTVLAACGGPKQPDGSGGGLRIFLDAPAVTAEQLMLFAVPSPSPVATANFNCFMVNVTGAGVSPAPLDFHDCEFPDNFNNKGMGRMSQPAPRGQTVVISGVPSGTGRNIDVFGIYPAINDCGGSPANGSVVGGYLVGTTTVDVAEDSAVTIPVSFTAGRAASLACTETNESVLTGSPTTVPFGTGSPAPSCSGLSIPQSVTLTNTGTSSLSVDTFSISGGIYSATSGGTCPSSIPPYTLTPGQTCAQRFTASMSTVGTYNITGYLNYTYNGQTRSLSLLFTGNCI